MRLTRRSFVLGTGAAVLAAPAVRAQIRERKVVFWHSYTQAARANFMRATADRFEAANPGVKVEIEVVPWGAFTQRWPAALAGNTLPDVSILLSENAVPMFLANALHPMDDTVRALGGPSAFKGNLLERTGRYRDQYVSVPHYVHNRILVYRKDRLAAANLQPPVTWDDALNAAVATTRAPDYFGWILKLSKADTGGGYLLWILTRSAGGRFFDADGNVAFDSAPVKDAVRFMTEIARRASGPGVIDYKISDNFSLINSGRQSMTEDSAAIVAGAAADAPQVAEQLDATFMPRRQQVGNLVGGISLALPKGRNPEDGKRFAQFLFAPENYLPFLHSIPLFMFPALKSADGPQFFEQPTIQRYRRVVEVTLQGLEDGSLACMEDGLNAFGGPVLANHAVEDMFQRILVDNQPIDQAVAAAARSIETTIRDVKRRLRPA
jgi:multiple sugar transport system substrate-binding protein